MAPRILAFRPASVVEHLDPRSHACPLSTRELIGPVYELGLVLPVVTCPISAVARGALVAAKEMQSALGLALPPGDPPEEWFATVTAAADEVAAGTPIFLCGSVVAAGSAAPELERVTKEAWKLVGAGLTHLSIDVAAVAPPDRGRVVAEVAQAATEHGLGVEVVVPLSEGTGAGPLLAAVMEDASRRGSAVDLAGVRCEAPEDNAATRLQALTLGRIAQAFPGTPLVRHGPVTAPLLELLRFSPVRMCDDGGVVSAQAVAAVPPSLRARAKDEAPARGNALERALAALPEDAVAWMEARAYMDALDFLERVGARGSGKALARTLLRRLEGP